MNVNTGDVAWKIPFGIYPELVAKGIPPTGTPNLGGPIATASGLVFIGATKDARFRAYDAKTGKELWYAQLEAAGGRRPMTFMGRNGVSTSSSRPAAQVTPIAAAPETYPQKLVAFALGRSRGDGGIRGSRRVRAARERLSERHPADACAAGDRRVG